MKFCDIYDCNSVDNTKRNTALELATEYNIKGEGYSYKNMNEELGSIIKTLFKCNITDDVRISLEKLTWLIRN